MGKNSHLEKFTYEIKDFEPCIRKNPKSQKTKIIISSIAVLVVVLIAFGLYKNLLYREKLGSEEAVKKAFSDLTNHYGKDSYVSEAIDGSEWFELVDGGTIGVEADVKLKELGDFGLGFESMVSGVNIKTDTLVDTKTDISSGNVKVGWTLFNLNAIDFYSDDSMLTMNSPEFFEETLVLDKSKLSVFDKPIAELYGKLIDLGLGAVIDELDKDNSSDDEEKDYYQSEIAKSEYGSMSINQLISQMKFSATYKDLKQVKRIDVDDGSVKCYGYLVEAKCELLTEPVMITLFVDKDYRLINMEVTYSYTLDDGTDTGFELKVKFVGDEHPADHITGTLDVYAGKDKATGSFDVKVKNEKENILTDIHGKLHVPGINLLADVNIDFDKKTGQFELDSEMTDEVDILEISSGGSLTNDKDNKKLKMTFDKFKVNYSGKKIFMINVKLALTDESGKNPADDAPSKDAKKIDILNYTQEDFDSVYNQIMDRVNYYIELLEEAM